MEGSRIHYTRHARRQDSNALLHCPDLNNDTWYIKYHNLPKDSATALTVNPQLSEKQHSFHLSDQPQTRKWIH